LLDCHVASRDMAKATGHGLARRVRFTMAHRIVDVPADVLIGLPTLPVRSTSLLQSVLAGLAEAEEIPAEVPAELVYEEQMPEDWSETASFAQLASESDSNLTAAQRVDLQTLMQEFPDLFGPARRGGFSVLTPMDIELYGGMWPKSLPPSHVSPAIQAEIDKAMSERIVQGWQRDLSSDSGIYSSPVVAAKQPGKDSRRICGDYRELNRCTKPCQYPVKNAQAITARMKGARYFTKLDLMKGYLQLPLTERASKLCEKWAPMILGHHFVVESDHKNLQWLEKATAPKLVRWRLRLQEFDFDLSDHFAAFARQIQYMVVADALSRLHAKKATPFAGVCAVGLSRSMNCGD
jgi:hypothetical protein